MNHIGIEATDVPADATLNEDKRVVRPQDRSGVVVRFPVQFRNGALLKLVDETGAPILLGSTATLRASRDTVSVGYDGFAYVENLSSHNDLVVTGVDGRQCIATFDYKPVPGDIPSIGPLRCQKHQP